MFCFGEKCTVLNGVGGEKEAWYRGVLNPSVNSRGMRLGDSLNPFGFQIVFNFSIRNPFILNLVCKSYRFPKGSRCKMKWFVG